MSVRTWKDVAALLEGAKARGRAEDLEVENRILREKVEAAEGRIVGLEEMVKVKRALSDEGVCRCRAYEDELASLKSLHAVVDNSLMLALGERDEALEKLAEVNMAGKVIVETLRDENAKLRAQLDDCFAEYRRHESLELAALREDKARLDWVQEMRASVSGALLNGLWDEFSVKSEASFHSRRSKDIRAAIDAARKAAQ